MKYLKLFLIFYLNLTLGISQTKIDSAINIMNIETIHDSTKIQKLFDAASSLSYDTNVVEILLSSAIDSVGGNVPSLVLTTEVVGKLPVTSDIQNR